MKVTANATDFTLSPETTDITLFVNNLETNYSDYLSKHIIVDLSSLNPQVDEVEQFQSIQDQHIANNKSFVIIVKDFDFNEATEGLNIVPTLQEAYDIIEMDDIQRDLGF
jgi:hypothetical protein